MNENDIKEKKEIGEILTDQEHLKELCKSKGWEIIKNKLIRKISQLSDILSYDNEDPQKLAMELAANQQAVKVLLEWLTDIEGEVKRGDYYRQELEDFNRETYLKYYN